MKEYAAVRSPKKEIPEGKVIAPSDACYENLANAIILQAVDDFVRAYAQHRRSPNDPSARRKEQKLEEFFTGQWFELLSNADGKEILERLKAGEDRR